MDVQPVSGLDADGFAASLSRMYGAWNGALVREEGLHRLVQRSPLDPKHTRLTSFVREDGPVPEAFHRLPGSRTNE